MSLRLILNISHRSRPPSEHAFVSLGLNTIPSQDWYRRTSAQATWVVPHTLSHICVNNALARDCYFLMAANNAITKINRPKTLLSPFPFASHRHQFDAIHTLSSYLVLFSGLEAKAHLVSWPSVIRGDQFRVVFVSLCCISLCVFSCLLFFLCLSAFLIYAHLNKSLF